jgi:hypothetical protein
MTEILNKEFSRKSFLKGGGAMIVGFSVAGAATAGKAGAAIDPYASPGPADPNAVDSFLIIHADNTASLKSGRIELGQGSTTGLRMIAAEELTWSEPLRTSRSTPAVRPRRRTPVTRAEALDLAGRPAVRRAGRGQVGCSRWPRRTPSARPGLSVKSGVVSGGASSLMASWAATSCSTSFTMTARRSASPGRRSQCKMDADSARHRRTTDDARTPPP